MLPTTLVSVEGSPALALGLLPCCLKLVGFGVEVLSTIVALEVDSTFNAMTSHFALPFPGLRLTSQMSFMFSGDCATAMSLRSSSPDALRAL
jgi:hypothetical protein